MYIVTELTAAMSVTEEVADDCKNDAYSLYWNMPSRMNDLRPKSVLAQSHIDPCLHTPRTMPVGKMTPHAVI